MTKPLEIQLASYLDEEGNPHHMSVGDYRALNAEHDTIYTADFMCNGYLSFIRRAMTESAAHPNIQMFEACTIIKDLERRRNGWAHREKTMSGVYESFLDNFDDFAPLRSHAKEFYKYVVRPHLYIASMEDWKIVNEGTVLFDAQTKTVNSLIILQNLKPIVEDYYSVLKEASWDDPVWKNFRRCLHADLKYWGYVGFDD